MGCLIFCILAVDVLLELVTLSFEMFDSLDMLRSISNEGCLQTFVLLGTGAATARDFEVDCRAVTDLFIPAPDRGGATGPASLCSCDPVELLVVRLPLVLGLPRVSPPVVDLRGGLGVGAARDSEEVLVVEEVREVVEEVRDVLLAVLDLVELVGLGEEEDFMEVGALIPLTRRAVRGVLIAPLGVPFCEVLLGLFVRVLVLEEGT